MNLLRQPTPGRLPAISLLFAIAAVLPPSAALAANGADRLSETETPRAARDLQRWLETDCEDANLMVLTRYKLAILSELVAALEKGAPADRRELVRREADESYTELTKYQDRKNRKLIGSSRDVYVKRDVDNFDAQYRARAAQALAAIGGVEVLAALEQSVAKAKRGELEIRDDVQRLMETLLRSLRNSR